MQGTHKGGPVFKTKPYVVATEGLSAQEVRAHGIDAVTSLTTRASRRWQPSSRRQHKPTVALPGDAYMPRAVVTGTGRLPRKRRNQTAPVIVKHMTAANLAPSNGGNPDA